MTQVGQQNHYNVKFLKGYGVSIRQKDHQIFLANGKDVFTGEQEKESYYIPQFPYEKIIISGDGYLSTRAIQLLLEKNVNLILTDTFGGLITSMSTPMSSIKATKYRMGQYQTFSDESKQIVLRKKFLSMKLEGQIQFLKSIRHIETKQSISGLEEFKKKLVNQHTHNDIHDIEAKSARLYFEHYQKLFDPKFEFTSRMSDVFNRSKENATNVINALLNYGYAVLASEILKYLNAFGLDPYYGFNHKLHDSFMALVYDIIEPYRVLVDSADDVFYLQNGIYRFNDKWKQRGLGKLGSKEIEHLETYTKKGRLYMKFKVLRSSRLRSSILQDNISDIGKFKTFEREVNLNADRKRFWLGEIDSIDSKTMNESMPISMNYFNIR